MNTTGVTEIQKQKGKWNGEYKSYYVKLAPEETPRKNYESSYDESSYDSFHNCETDICRDSSDDDDDSDASSSRTEGMAIMDVIEFEVPSSSDDDSSSGESSSGTDDFAFEAAAATHALMEYDAIMNKNYEEDDDEFILADTEESDGSCDLELSQHDYWKCVKCNNKQNNPLYRYCERCYQVRKSLFPPRPRKQKSRSEHNLKRKMTTLQDYSSSSDLESEDQAPVTKKIALMASPKASGSTLVAGSSKINIPSSSATSGNNCNIKSSTKHENSAGELSCNNNTSSCEDDGEDGNTSQISRQSSIAENKIIQNVYRQDMSTTRKMSPPNSLERKQSHDSGMSSCQESSQDLSPMESNLARSSSSSSSHSADLYSNTTLEFANSQVTEDDSDNDNILQRIDEYSRENYNLQQKKMLAKEKGVKYEDDKKNSLQEDSSKLGPSRSTDSFDSIEDINESNLGLCRFCMINPKNGVFVHSNCLHLCCCYKCAVKVWKTRKSCPICNCKIKNVAKLFVH
ncbi:unnamed protein product [Diamesa serratosioi]